MAENSTLEITVLTTGLNGNSGAPAQLNRLADAADKAEPKVKSLLATVEKLMGAQRTGTAAAEAYAKAIQSTTTSITGGSGGTNTLAAATTKLGQSMVVLAESLSKVRTNSDQSTQSVFKHTAAMSDAQAMARGLSGSLGALWVTYGSLIPMATGIALGASMKQIVTIGAEVEHTLEGIRVRGQESIQSIDSMRTVIMDLGKGVYGPKEVSKALEVLILAGLDAGKAVIGVKDALNLATVGGTTIEKAAEGLVQVGTALNYSAEGYSRIADVISMTAAASMSSVDSITESFKAGSAVGKLYGASLVDIGTAFAALSNLGIKGSAAGTATKNFYSELAGGSVKVTNALAQLKLKITDLQDEAGNFKPLTEVFEILKNGTGNAASGMVILTEAGQKLAISNLSNERGNKLMTEGLSLVGKAGEDTANKLSDLAKKIDESFGFAAIGAAAMALTVESQFKSVKNTLETQFLAAFTDIQPQLSMIARDLKNAFNSPEFLSAIQSIALAVANLTLMVVENLDKIKLFVEIFLGYKAISFVAGLLIGIAEGFLILKTAMEASRIAAIAFQVSLGALAIVLTAAAAAWAWYHLKKDDSGANTKANLAYMDDFTSKLDQEATRLENQIKLMKEGKTARDAVTDSIRNEQLALVSLNGDKAVAAEVGKVVALKEKMNPLERKAYEQIKVTGGKASGAVAEVILQERQVDAAITTTNKKREEAVVQMNRLAKAAETVAKIGDAQAKEAGRVPGGSANFEKIGKKKAGATDNEGAKEDAQFASRMANMAVQIRAQEELRAGLEKYGMAYTKIGPGLKEVYRIEYDLSLLNGKGLTDIELRTKRQLNLELVKAKQLAGLEEENTLTKRAIEDADKEAKATETKIAHAAKEADAAERKAAAYGKLKGTATELLIIQEEGVLKSLREIDVNSTQAQQQEDYILQLRRKADAEKSLGLQEGSASALKELDHYLNPKKALDFGNSMKEAFGSVGEGIDKMAAAWDKYGDSQHRIVKERALNEKLMLNPETAKQGLATAKKIDAEELKNKLHMYGGMATAAKSFFKEGTTGYKVMAAVEKGIRIAELAMQIESFAIKSGLVAAFTEEKVASATTGMAVDNEETGNSIANSIMEGGASMAAAAAKLFEQLGVDGFIAVGAMVALLAGMGLSGGSGAGAAPDTSAATQKVAGTGTVLGDENAKSTSIADSISILAANSNITLHYTSSMLTALNKIKDGIGGLASFVSQSAGLRGTPQDTAGLGLGASKSFLGFSSESKTLTDTGLLVAAGQTIGSVIAEGIKANSYQDTHSESSSFFGLFNSNSDDTSTGSVSSGLTDQLSLTVKSLSDGVQKAAGFLKLSSADLVGQLNAMSIDLNKISFKGLTGKEIEAQLEAVFGALGDKMAKLIAPGIDAFAKVGEGYFQTLVRVSVGVDVASGALKQLGIRAVNFTEVLNKQGDVGAEIVRQSLVNQEATIQSFTNTFAGGGLSFTSFSKTLTGVGDILQNMQGDAQALVDTYKQLIAVRQMMSNSGLGSDLNESLITAAGGLDALQSALSVFDDKFYTDVEKHAKSNQILTASFLRLGLSMPRTNAEFKALVTATSQYGGQELLGNLLSLSGAFADFTAATETATTAAKDAAKTAADTAKAAVDTARTDLTTAYQKESSVITETKTKFLDFAKSLRTFQQSLLTGGTSPLTDIQKYAVAKGRFDSTASLAATGDKDAISAFQGAANDLLTISRTVNASSDAYTRDFNKVQDIVATLALSSDTQVSAAQQNLDLLNKQVDGLMTVNTSVLTVTEAVNKLTSLIAASATANAAMAAASAASAAPNTPYNNVPTIGTFDFGGGGNGGSMIWATESDGSHANGLSYVPFDGYKAELHKGEAVLTASENKSYQMNFGAANDSAMNDGLKEMAAEIASLKAEIRKQTGTLVATTYDAHEQSTQGVVAGIGGAVNDSARRDVVKNARLN